MPAAGEVAGKSRLEGSDFRRFHGDFQGCEVGSEVGYDQGRS